MKLSRWQIEAAVALVLLSVLVYAVHYAIFRDAHHIFMFMLHELAFVPIEVLVVTLIIHRVLHHREKLAMLGKLNMVVGAFFSEVGTGLIRHFRDLDPKAGELAGQIKVTARTTDAELRRLACLFQGYDGEPNVGRADLNVLREYLTSRRTFLLGLLENPNLLEHEEFTDLLWAVFHLTEELVNRRDVNHLTETDAAHLQGDIRRAYGRLIVQWLAYMRHLRSDYPYLFSLAVRTNPFDPAASVEVTQ
ncbi:MAG: hypothetical protein JXL80_11570 [Planctomycetes bacterium]|nr:hypothetical protein [Planctomycetota bacterium]